VAPSESRCIDDSSRPAADAAALVAALSDPVFVVDGDGRVDLWNDAALSATGRGEPALRAAPLVDLFASPADERVATALDRAGVDGRSVVEAPLPTADGALRPHEFELSALPGGGLLVVGRPVTDHQRALERVRDGFFSLDERWHLTYVNEAAVPVLADAMGVDTTDRSALVGRHLWDAVPAAVDTPFYDHYHEAVRTGDPVSFEASCDPLGLRLEVSAFPSESGLSVYFRDVTERHERTVASERQASVLREIYEVVADRTLSFEAQVAALLEIGTGALGVEFGTLSRIDGDRWIAEVVEAPPGTIDPGEVYPLSATNCERAAATERTLVLGDVAADAPGLTERAGFAEWGISCYLGAPVHVDDGVYGTFCFYDTAPRGGFDDWEVTVVDLMARWVSAGIERERRTARLERQNERLDRFASFVSHDLRNPLSVLRGRIDLAEETGDAAEFAACRRAADRMDAMIDDLLTLARAGEVEDRSTVALAAAAERAWESVDESAAALRVEADRTVRADRGLLDRLLENLFRNAVEHGSTADDDPVTVTVGDLPDGFSVADDGPGISPDDRDRVFDAGYTTDRDGTGFGLAIVAEVAAAHGWSVRATESESGGTRIEVTGV
jgi:signal transduction histidine kinase/PAS domain-containing protein